MPFVKSETNSICASSWTPQCVRYVGNYHLIVFGMATQQNSDMDWRNFAIKVCNEQPKTNFNAYR